MWTVEKNKVELEHCYLWKRLLRSYQSLYSINTLEEDLFGGRALRRKAEEMKSLQTNWYVTQQKKTKMKKPSLKFQDTSWILN